MRNQMFNIEDLRFDQKVVHLLNLQSSIFNLQSGNCLKNNERGNVLVTSLMILLVMNLLGIGLANLATKQWGVATYKSIDAEVFGMTDTCSQDVILWFETQTSTPASVSSFSSTESANVSTYSKLSGYSYGCTVAFITTKEGTSSRTSGGEVGNSGGAYGASGTNVPKDYYQITSTGAGPKGASKVINSIISVEY